jgi:transposase
VDGMRQEAYVAERLDHLGIVAGVCREIGLAAWLDEQDTHRHERVSVGTATVAMILNGLGFSNRRLYLVSQFFATKAVERLLGAGIQADDLNDDCLGRALDWLYAHDPTTLFAGIALRARRAFGISARQVHVDTTSFAVTGEYEPDLDAHTLAVTYGYSRDHRADLKQWMLALATTRHGDVPLFCQALDGNASDKVSVVAAVEALADQLRGAAEAEEDEEDEEDEEEAPIFVADSGLSSAENVTRLSTAGVRWVSRVPETSTEARAALQVADEAWQHEGDLFWAADRPAPQGERWVVVRTTQGEERARATLHRQVEKTREQGEKALWHLGNQRVACAPDAHAALAQQLKKRPTWLTVQARFVQHAKHAHPGRPRTGASPDHSEWQIETTLTVDEAAVAQAVRRQAAFLVATNVLDPQALSDHELIQTHKDQHSVERGFAFLKDPLFLASSVFVKKPERIVALALVMVLCLLVYRLAEHRLREQLAAPGQTIPSQVNKPTDRPTMRWVFQCFEGIDLLHIRHGPDPAVALVLRLQPLHQQVLALLGPSYEAIYQLSVRKVGCTHWIVAVGQNGAGGGTRAAMLVYPIRTEQIRSVRRLRVQTSPFATFADRCLSLTASCSRLAESLSFAQGDALRSAGPCAQRAVPTALSCRLMRHPPAVRASPLVR